MKRGMTLGIGLAAMLTVTSHLQPAQAQNRCGKIAVAFVPEETQLLMAAPVEQTVTTTTVVKTSKLVSANVAAVPLRVQAEPVAVHRVSISVAWTYNPDKGYFFKTLTLPSGGHQYLIHYANEPDWVYWYNPAKGIFWCACPTVNHPQFGERVAAGEELAIMAHVKGKTIEKTRFAVAEIDGGNLVAMQVRDADNSLVTVQSVPDDLP